MASSIDSHLGKIHDARYCLVQLLDGMDYCLDWKPNPSAWSARQVVYHLLDTPPGGLVWVIDGIISGNLTEYDLWSDMDNMTPERQVYDIQEMLQDITVFFDGLEGTLSKAKNNDLLDKRALVHHKTRHADNEHTMGEILEAGFEVHWAGHLEQLNELKQSLGV